MAARHPSSPNHHAIEMPPVGTVGGDHNWFDVHMAIPPEEGFSVVEEATKEREKRNKKKDHVALALFPVEDSKDIGGSGAMESSLGKPPNNDTTGDDDGSTQAEIVSKCTEKADQMNRDKKTKNTDGASLKDGESEDHGDGEGDEGWNKKAWSLLDAENHGDANSNPKQGKFDSPETFWSQGKLKKWEDTNYLIINGKLRVQGDIESVGDANEETDSSDIDGDKSSDLNTGTNEKAENHVSIKEKPVTGQRRISQKDEFFKNHKKGSGWNIRLLENRKRTSDEITNYANDTSFWIFKNFSVKTAAKKKRLAKLFADSNNGFLSTFLRLRQERLARRQKKRRSYPWIVHDNLQFVTAVHIFLDLMYYFCMSPYKRVKTPREKQTYIGYIFKRLQPIIFGLFAIFTIWKSFADVKRYVLIFVDKRGPEDLYDIASYTATGCTVTYAIYFLVFRQDEIEKTLKHWELYEACTSKYNIQTIERKTNRLRWIVWICGVGSILFAILRTAFNNGFSDWTFGDMFLQNAADFCAGFETWTVEDHKKSYLLYQKYATMDSFVFRYVIGSLGLAMKIFSHAEMDAVRNLLIFVALVNNKHTKKFGKMAQRTISSMIPFFNNYDKHMKCWRLYRLAREDNAVTNFTFGTLLKMCHGTNALLFAYLFTLILDKKTNMIHVAFILYELMKAAYTYYVARKTVKYNATAEQWIKSLPDKCKQFLVGSVPYSKLLMLFELVQDPFGLGTGPFRIDDTFIYKLLGGGGSLVIILLTFHYSGIGNEETGEATQAN